MSAAVVRKKCIHVVYPSHVTALTKQYGKGLGSGTALKSVQSTIKAKQQWTEAHDSATYANLAVVTMDDQFEDLFEEEVEEDQDSREALEKKKTTASKVQKKRKNPYEQAEQATKEFARNIKHARKREAPPKKRKAKTDIPPELKKILATFVTSMQQFL